MVILGHRGSGWQDDQLPWYIENSLLAFAEAEELGADGIETDVRLYNNELVLHHDPIIECGWERSPTKLVDVLEWANDSLVLNLEIKDSAAVDPLIDMLRSYDNKTYIISSFWHKAVVKVKEELSFVEAGLILPFNPISSLLLKELIPPCIDVIVWDYTILDRKLVHTLADHKHFVYNVGGGQLSWHIEDLNGIISDDLSLHVSK
jgi:hypothetical protein